MRFLADECCDAATVDILRSKGHDILYVFETMRGATDDEILRRAYLENRILLTEDKDFGELVYRLQHPAYGIILLRFNPVEQHHKHTRLLQVLREYADQLVKHFIVIEVDKIRIRSIGIT
jgi:predicted nuclease of predicted toxin-antitoxin system